MLAMTDLLIRNVPDELATLLRAEAERNGQSVQAYLRGQLDQVAVWIRRREAIAESSAYLVRVGARPVTDEERYEALDAATVEREVHWSDRRP